MDKPRRLWLIDNASSGSNDEDALTALEETCGDAGFHVAHRTCFPRYEMPTVSMLDAAGIDLVAVFAGDGTINAAIENLAGWGGAVLVLPGGTMNLLYHRLHGDREMEEVIRLAASGKTRGERPAMVRGPGCHALAGLMAGPGTSWNKVREAMRDNSVIDMAGEAAHAIEETLEGPMVACVEPPLGKPEGYPLILLNPREEGIVVEAYHAENASELLQQSVALMKRDFREGPHDELGCTERVVLESTGGNPIGLLVDGEPVEVPARAEFTLAACKVDLLATAFDG